MPASENTDNSRSEVFKDGDGETNLAAESEPLMRNGCLGTLIALFVGTGLGLAQGPTAPAVRTGDYSSGNPYAPSNGPAQMAPSAMPDSETGYAGEGAGCPYCNGTGPGCDGGEPDCSRYRFYARGEYLLWHIEDSHLPPLLANTVVGTATVPVGSGTQAVPVLAQATFNAPGGPDISFRDQSGARVIV